MNENKKIMKITNDEGKVFDAEIVMSFDIKKYGKTYVIYKFADEEEKDLETIHTSILKKMENGEYTLEEIVDDSEWKDIKMIMKKVIDSEEA